MYGSSGDMVQNDHILVYDLAGRGVKYISTGVK